MPLIAFLFHNLDEQPRHVDIPLLSISVTVGPGTPEQRVVDVTPAPV